MLPTKEDLKTLPIFAPLIAALLAPLSTLLDIPALTEPWFFQEDPDTGQLNKLVDSRTCIALSALGLAFNVLANALLILRFSTMGGLWKSCTHISLACWVAKFGIAVGNILAFGILSRNTPDISYGEGFWCAFVSALLVLVIVILLMTHFWFYVRGKMHEPFSESQIRVRVAGRHFMLENTLFVVTIAILALYMSRLEHWTYLQGIYFSVVSILTVGFGDFVPTRAATRIVLFPFILIGIVQLAAIINLIVRFFRSRLASHRAMSRRLFEKKRQEQEDELVNEPTLQREMEFLRKIYHDTSHLKSRQDLMASCFGFVLFWLLGAVIFSEIESWTYGEGLYFCYVFFFTIGYGDLVPVTPAGRVVFVVYSIFAVPIMASFAVQTIQSSFQQFSQAILSKRVEKASVGKGVLGAPDPTASSGTANAADDEKALPQDVRERIEHNAELHRFRSHAEFVAEGYKQIEARFLPDASEDGRNSEEARTPDEEEAAEQAEDRIREDRILTEYILELVVELERRSRRLLLGHLEEGSTARMLLNADRIVQLQNIKALAAQEQTDQGSTRMSSETASNTNGVSQRNNGKTKVNAMMRKYYEEESELLPFPTDLDETKTLEEIARYREAFAGILAAGSRLLRLKDEEKFLFERRHWKGSREEG